MYVHIVGGTESYTTSTTTMYNKYFTYQVFRDPVHHTHFFAVEVGVCFLSHHRPHVLQLQQHPVMVFVCLVVQVQDPFRVEAGRGGGGVVDLESG